MDFPKQKNIRIDNRYGKKGTGYFFRKKEDCPWGRALSWRIEIILPLIQAQLFQCHREERRRFLRFSRNRLCDLVKKGLDYHATLATVDCHALSGLAMTL